MRFLAVSAELGRRARARAEPTGSTGATGATGAGSTGATGPGET